MSARGQQFKKVVGRVCGVTGDCSGSAEVAGRGDVLQRGWRATSDSFCYSTTLCGAFLSTAEQPSSHTEMQ